MMRSKCCLEKGCYFDLVKSSRLLHDVGQFKKWGGDGDGEDNKGRHETIHNRTNYFFLIPLTV